MYLVQCEELASDWQAQEIPPSCDFVVAGSTGNIYTVQIANIPTCTCPDFLRKQDLCKHIFFVLLKCIGIEENSFLLYQKAFLNSEIKELFIKMEQRRTGGAVQASAAVRAAYQKRAGVGGTAGTKDNDDEDDGTVKRKSLEADADCPICFDPLEEGTLVFCRGTCGTNFHAGCIQRWMAQAAHRNCPNCRQPWFDPNSSSGRKRSSDEGYMNIGDITGQSTVRDGSTYYKSSRRRYY